MVQALLFCESQPYNQYTVCRPRLRSRLKWVSTEYFLLEFVYYLILTKENCPNIPLWAADVENKIVGQKSNTGRGRSGGETQTPLTRPPDSCRDGWFSLPASKNRSRLWGKLKHIVMAWWMWPLFCGWEKRSQQLSTMFGTHVSGIQYN